MYSPFLYILLTNSSFCIFQVIIMMKTLELHCTDNEDQAVKYKKRAKELQETIAPLQEKNVALGAKVKKLEGINANHLDHLLQVEGSNVQLSKEAEELKVKLIQSKADAIVEHMSSNEYLQEMGMHYVPGFENFKT